MPDYSKFDFKALSRFGPNVGVEEAWIPEDGETAVFELIDWSSLEIQNYGAAFS